MKIIEKWIDLKYKYKIIIYLSIFFTAAVIAFSMYFYKNYMSQVMESTKELSQTNVAQISKQIDEKLTNLKNYYLANLSNDEITYILENNLDYHQYSKMKAAMDTLSGNNILSGYICGYTFINYKTGWALSHKGMFPSSDILNHKLVNALYDRNNLKIDKNYWYYDDETESLGVEHRNYRLFVDTNGLNLIMKLPSANLYIYGMVIVNISRHELIEWITEGLPQKEDMVVLDTNGKVIYSTNSKLNKLLIQTQEKGEDFENRIRNEEGDSFVIAKGESTVLNWNYYIINHWDNVTKETKNYSISMLLLIIGVLIIIDVLIGYGIYTPINLLTKKASLSGKKEVKLIGNELQFLSSRIDNLMGNNAKLEEKVQEQRNRVMELFELRLLRGELMAEGIDSYIKKLQIESVRDFSALAIIFRTGDELKTLASEREDTIGNELVNGMPEELRKCLSLQPIYYARALFCVISEEDAEVMVHVIMDFYNNLKKYVENTYGLQIGVGVSTIHSDIHQLDTAYQESIYALNGYIQNESEDIHSGNYSYCEFYTKQECNGKKSFENSFEKEIRAAIMGCDKEQAYNAVGLFFGYLKQQQLNHNDMVLYLVQYTNTILFAAAEFGLELEHLFKDSISEIYLQMIRIYNLDKSRKYIKYTLIDPVMEAMDSINSTQTHVIMEKVQKLIEEYKGNITLTECADLLHYHPTYIWKILKMEKNKSFTNYLEEYKIEQAKHLLEETDLTIAEIATQLNYTNAQNFIRFFSKLVGTTPGKYRNALHG